MQVKKEKMSCKIIMSLKQKEGNKISKKQKKDVSKQRKTLGRKIHFAVAITLGFFTFMR